MTRAIGGGFIANVRAGVDRRDLRVHNARLRRVRHPASNGRIRRLRSQCAEIQRQKENQRKSGDFVHDGTLWSDLHCAGFALMVPFSPVSETITN